MKKTIALILALVLVVSGGAVALAGDSIPSTKAAHGTTDVTTLTTSWSEMLRCNIKTGNMKDLIIQVSAECALVTNAGKGNTTKGDKAQARIEVRALVLDEAGTVLQKVAVPGTGDMTTGTGVIFTDRKLEVKGSFEDPTDFIEIWLATKAAHHYNFLAEDVPTGTHTVVVQAQKFLDDDGGTSDATAMFGNVTVYVEEVNLK
jgi:hypothetical protein